jgi:hypothetical protein
MDTLRFTTCGSVDDGKSTLIGRLLYESKLVFEDQHCGGHEKEAKFVGSDINAFLPHTSLAVPLDDGEYAILSPDTNCIKGIADGDERNRKVTQVRSQGHPAADLLHFYR